MKQIVDGEVLGEVSFYPTIMHGGDTRFVVFSAKRVSLLLDAAEVRALIDEAEAAAVRAFGENWRDR